MKEYPDHFLEEGSHGHCYELLAEAKLGDGVVLDLGCATGQLAEPFAALGNTYVGADIEAGALAELTERGFEGHVVDLSVGVDELAAAIEEVLDGRPLAAVLLLDVLEHLMDPVQALRGIAKLAERHPGVELVVSIPNVTHLDVGIKLLMGRWDMTDTGLLDDTHVRFFNEDRVRTTLAEAGWAEAAVKDVALPVSDQLFPVDAPALRPGTPLRQLLYRIRTAADPHAETYQFVRRFTHDPAAAATTLDAVQRESREDTDARLLTVVVRLDGSESAPVAEPPATDADDATPPGATDADDATPPRAGDAPARAAAGPIDGLLGDLGRQTTADVELLVSHPADIRPAVTVPAGLGLGERVPVRFVPTGPGDDWRGAAFAAAQGRYVTMLERHTRLTAGYVETVRQAVDVLPGQVVQVGAVAASTAATTGVADVDELVPTFERVALDPLDLVSVAPFGPAPLGAHAIPRQAFAANGLRFDAEAGDTIDTLFLLGAVELCGIVRSSEPAVVLHPAGLHSLSLDVESLQKRLGLTPMVIPEGAGPMLLALRVAAGSAVPERDALAEQVSALRDQVASLAWHLRVREEELEQARAEAASLRHAVERNIGIRARRKIGEVLHKA